MFKFSLRVFKVEHPFSIAQEFTWIKIDLDQFLFSLIAEFRSRRALNISPNTSSWSALISYLISTFELDANQ